MIRNKFQYKTVNRIPTEMDWSGLKLSMAQYDEGEVIVRKKVRWDTDQMRKYFHKVALAFIEEQERERGVSTSQSAIKRFLKEEYGPRELLCVGGREIASVKSTGDYTFDEYKKILNDTNAYCMDVYECELPPAEQVE